MRSRRAYLRVPGASLKFSGNSAGPIVARGPTVKHMSGICPAAARGPAPCGIAHQHHTKGAFAFEE